MVSVAEFTVPTEALPLEEMLTTVPESRIDVEAIVPTSESVVVIFWVKHVDAQAVMSWVDGESILRNPQIYDHVEDRVLFRAEVSMAPDLIARFRSLDCTIRRVTASAEAWHFVVWAPDRTDFGRFRDVFERADVPVKLVSVADHPVFAHDNPRPLTTNQRETLLAAYQGGYFDSPRQISQEGLGERFGISHRAISERLRRGMRNLIESSLAPPRPNH